MQIERYFEETHGLGVLSTADESGRVNTAVYARPHVLEDGTLAFVMRDRLSHHNLQSNPHAAYLFRADGGGYHGLRLHLSKLREETDTPMVKELCRRCRIDGDPDAIRHVVVFSIDRQLPLVGGGED